MMILTLEDYHRRQAEHTNSTKLIYNGGQLIVRVLCFTATYKEGSKNSWNLKKKIISNIIIIILLFGVRLLKLRF
jgi:heme/copper-type cytochrome/quinol oxidase subunit 4